MHTVPTGRKLDPKLDIASSRRFQLGDVALRDPTYLRILAFEFFVRKHTFDSLVTVDRMPRVKWDVS